MHHVPPKIDLISGDLDLSSGFNCILTVDVECLRLLALADGVADLALDDGAVLAPVEAVDAQQGPVVPRHDGVRQEPPQETDF